MLFDDRYRTIAGPAQAEFKDRGSRFIAFAFPVHTEEDARNILKELRKEHHAAAHHCWALVLGPSKEFKKSNDDREPANSAGKPILRAILSLNLTYVLVVVVRYFGGKLLGVPGLIHAYGTASEVALNSATIAEKIMTEKYMLACSYEERNEAFRILKQFGVKTGFAADFENNSIIFEVRKTLADKVITQLKQHRFNPSPIP